MGFCDQLCCFPLGGGLCALVFLQENTCAFPDNGLGGAYIHALSAADAFLVANMVNIQLAMADAQTALGTFGLFHLHTEEGDLIEKTVKSAQRAEETAEQPEDKYTTHQNADHQGEFPGKQRAKQLKIAFVHRIGK